MATLMLVDGNSLTYRAFHALPTDMATASGQVTNAVFGFTSMLINAMKDHKPDALVVAWDLPQPTFRHVQVDTYKAGRSETPDILRQQFGLVRQVVEVLAIPLVTAPGFEADDVIATLATQARQRGDTTLVLTGDRDSYQLVADADEATGLGAIRVLYTRRGVADIANYDEAGIKERTGVTPEVYPQYAALRGDPSDNLPGVPGVGEKTAAKLINEHGGIAGIYANLAGLTPKLRANLEGAAIQVGSNVSMMMLVRDVPLDVDVSTLSIGGYDIDEVKKLFTFLEFGAGLWGRLQEALGGPGVGLDGPDSTPDGSVLEVDVICPIDARTAAAAIADAAGPDGVALAATWDGKHGRSPLLTLALASIGGVPIDASSPVLWLSTELLADAQVLAALGGLLGHGGVRIVAHDAKPILRSLAGVGVDAAGLALDTAVAAYLLDPSKDTYLLEEVATKWAGVEVRSPDAAPLGELDLGANATPPGEDEARRAAACALLVAPLTAAMEVRGLADLYRTIELPLTRVLAKMEAVGVRVDVLYLRELIDRLTAEVRTREATIQELAGHPFTVNSTPQLRTVLFDELGLTPSKKTKTGFSTDAQSLEKIRDQHAIVEELLRYREVEKLRSTYGDAFLNAVQPDGRIHATFSQTVARTGRLSSEDPNLHNIPVRSEEGRQFRRAFLPEEGWSMLVADYNQIELRVIAHLSQDPGLVEAFVNGTDIHTTTAARVFHVDVSEVTPAQRAKAKMVSYGLAYGMEAYGLAQRLSIGRDEAAGLRTAYFEAFPAVEAFMDDLVAEARNKGYTETMFGRRRLLPELASGNFQTRLAAERQAMNAPIQGLAADIFKVALVRLDQALADGGHEARVVLQVHDEVVLEVPPAEADVVRRLTIDVMHDAADLSVPLEVNVSSGHTWADAKG